KMRAILPPTVCPINEPHPRFMDQRRALQRMARGFLRHPRRGEFSQFLVDERQQFLGGLALAVANCRQNPRDVIGLVGHLTSREFFAQCLNEIEFAMSDTLHASNKEVRICCMAKTISTWEFFHTPVL